MPNVRREDDETSSARPSWRESHCLTWDSRVAPVAPVDGSNPGRRSIEPANVNDGYTSEELETHANEQLRSSAANASSNALQARVRQPRKPLGAHTSRVSFQRTASKTVTASSRIPETAAEPETPEPSAK